MVQSAFYDSLDYRERQSVITKYNHALGIYEHLKKKQVRTCKYSNCHRNFFAKPHSPKRFCTRSCAGKENSPKRAMSESVKQKIRLALKGRESPFKGIIKVQREERTCQRSQCSKSFMVERWRNVRFCSVTCAMKVTGARPTSPKASRGKAGIRKDISSTIYFYSRWEANMARLYTYLGISWVYAPMTFDIGGHTYTPDFYLPHKNTYVEVKNFWNEYSRVRDERFRKKYRNLSLKVILKDEYLDFERNFSRYIIGWEYATSPFVSEKT